MFPTPCLAAITDRTLLSPNWTLAQAIAPAITGGVNLIILREAELPTAAYRTIFEFVRDGIKGRVPLVLFNRPDMAAAADGLVLPGQADEIKQARAQIGKGKLLGGVIRGAEHVREISAAGADFGLAVLNWADPDHALDLLHTLCSTTDLPILAGIDPPLDVVRRCISAGGAGVAICSPVMSAYDRTAAARNYRLALQISLP